ncbi:MAG: hypothetical protein LBL08_01240 [Candidatus Nomurabacteria bacterium]|jgi:hypothetical protein|nr:hypothetical protein [Candidatus Nomurabacteria bacterium]
MSRKDTLSTQFQPTKSEIAKTLDFVFKNNGSVGSLRDQSWLAGALRLGLYGDNRHHQDATRAMDVAEWMVSAGLLTATRDQQGRVSKIEISQLAEMTNDDGSIVVKPELIMLAGMTTQLQLTRQQLRAQNEDDEILSRMISDVEAANERAEAAEARVAELEARPSDEDLLAEVSDLKRKVYHLENDLSSTEQKLQASNDKLNDTQRDLVKMTVRYGKAQTGKEIVEGQIHEMVNNMAEHDKQVTEQAQAERLSLVKNILKTIFYDPDDTEPNSVLKMIEAVSSAIEDKNPEVRQILHKVDVEKKKLRGSNPHKRKGIRAKIKSLANELYAVVYDETD